MVFLGLLLTAIERVASHSSGDSQSTVAAHRKASLDHPNAHKENGYYLYGLVQYEMVQYCTYLHCAGMSERSIKSSQSELQIKRRKKMYPGTSTELIILPNFVSAVKTTGKLVY